MWTSFLGRQHLNTLFSVQAYQRLKEEIPQSWEQPLYRAGLLGQLRRRLGIGQKLQDLSENTSLIPRTRHRPWCSLTEIQETLRLIHNGESIKENEERFLVLFSNLCHKILMQSIPWDGSRKRGLDWMDQCFDWMWHMPYFISNSVYLSKGKNKWFRQSMFRGRSHQTFT